MKTRCPDCQTVFRVTPEQLRARAGKVRCGHCQAVFNALDSLLEERHPATEPPPAEEHPAPVPAAAWSEPEPFETAPETPPSLPASEPEIWEPAPGTPAASDEPSDPDEPPGPDKSTDPDEPPETPVADPAAGLILPRETTEIPGYSKWAEGVMASPIALAQEKPSHWPFKLAAAVLVLALAGQALFHFRGELAVAMPALRPALEAFSLALGSPLPLPRHVELVSIETSDLQIDPGRDKLLVLNATLRNKAPYGQAYPSLELALTDTQDTVIARRLFGPADYLPAKTAADPVFPGNSDVAVRLWIEAEDLGAAGYRLFVFYP